MEDKDILIAFKDPDTRHIAFRELVDKYKERVYWHARKIVIDHEDADDVAQEAFIKVYKNLEGFREASQLFTWIYRITTNEALNLLKKKQKKQGISIDEVAHELEHSLTSSNLLSGEEIQLKLQKALLQLPEKQRLVFNMKYFDDLKYDEISEITGTSVGGLKASYHLAVKKIETYLTEG
ncbi:RNA polymerase sigma-70 factor (ECF subfamily) [Roseivirga pacifica]|uniref:RNA polymerase sigma factor n=1 Tax=Roseivirga pacifica TaxID=1267423 RepID=A0A1I0QZY0_9BACT|nr:sigma-70 family RNA polymerase sigma factor [Roseivirga pacifica]MCO6357476.1 sigma-70 family RNA polymerase sigma factor [Roseivirga pacifica]MCO6367759.1 sigma-70 family RNA polymerase sigma factor [Roseivirga pacifica]MCO6369709.1 sigma-70 family RNA polymerase sigma factor [Roseivirga pacifica]MCO6373563.1 sigma-70 family RNA polymerase sigma factor [Roseivirga pacifica]MCO6377132.1 sigma-70 family RNA polymerase sigma factor [Roseivirga pacifica]